MTVKDAMAVLTKVKPGTFGVRVKYIAELPIAKRAIKSGAAANYNQNDCYKEVTRLCRVKVRWYNTQYQKERVANGAVETHDVPKGFKKPTNPEENGLIYYNIVTDMPYLRLQQGGKKAVKNGVSAKFYVNGNEVSFTDVENLVNQGIFTAAAAKPVADLPFFLLNLDKVVELTLMGKEVDSEEESQVEEAPVENNTEDSFDESLDLEAQKWGYRNYKEYSDYNK